MEVVLLYEGWKVRSCDYSDCYDQALKLSSTDFYDKYVLPPLVWWQNTQLKHPKTKGLNPTTCTGWEKMTMKSKEEINDTDVDDKKFIFIAAKSDMFHTFNKWANYLKNRFANISFLYFQAKILVSIFTKEF